MLVLSRTSLNFASLALAICPTTMFCGLHRFQRTMIPSAHLNRHIHRASHHNVLGAMQLASTPPSAAFQRRFQRLNLPTHSSPHEDTPLFARTHRSTLGPIHCTTCLV
ncbi:hypothetical protein B0H19DRAFT_432253 [Mycena capillaripes]|nr:hypothetical protein B0H19DRAFT_432253 [Mycena capillaripes]